MIKNRLYILSTDCLTDKASFDKWHNRMPQGRKERIDAIKPEGAKRLCLGAGILLDEALRSIGICEYETGLGAHGKPYLVEVKADADDSVCYNISHSGNLAVLAVSDREVGVDVQEFRHFSEKLASQVFSEGERNLAHKVAERDYDFFGLAGSVSALDIAYTRLWAMKESLMKHSGMGMLLRPDQIELREASGDRGRIEAICSNYDCAGLSFTEYTIPGYALTVCSGYGDFGEMTEITEI